MTEHEAIKRLIEILEEAIQSQADAVHLFAEEEYDAVFMVKQGKYLPTIHPGNIASHLLPFLKKSCSGSDKKTLCLEHVGLPPIPIDMVDEYLSAKDASMRLNLPKSAHERLLILQKKHNIPQQQCTRTHRVRGRRYPYSQQ